MKVFGFLYRPKGRSEIVVQLPVEQITYSSFQPRKKIYDETLEELSQSIREHGVVQPVIVRKAKGGYELVTGHRRLEASRMAGLTTIPAIVREVAEREVLELALVENLQRKDLNCLEEAEGYRYLLEEFGLTQEQIARRVGKSRAAVANTLRLLNLPKEVLENVSRETISMGHARALLSLRDEFLQIKALREILRKRLSVRQAEELVKRLSRGKESAGTSKPKGAPQFGQHYEAFRSLIKKAVEALRRRGFEVTLIEVGQEDYLELKIRVPRPKEEPKAELLSSQKV